MPTIQTTHAGSLPRPHDLLDLMKGKVSGKPYDKDAYEKRVKTAVEASVRKQVDSGIDIVTDGEQSKPGFFLYVNERLEGFTPRPGMRRKFFPAETAAFPEYYAQYFKQAMLGGTVAPVVPMVCTGPVRYRGEAALALDIANLKAAAAAAGAKGVFMPAVAPSGVGVNEYYRSEEEFFHAVGAALSAEYRAIVDAGFTLQIDDPFLSDVFVDPDYDAKGRTARARMYVEALNASLQGIPPEKVRFHTCYGINEGPRIHEAALADVVDAMLAVNAGAYSFEAANPRHEHEYHQEADPGRDHPRQQHRRAPGADRRAPAALHEPGRIRRRHRRRGLRLLFPGDLQPRSASDRDLGEVPGHARRRADRK
jgi:5-methyltetrahydropteroyltriglutamate--homocysteine methyltransferase